MTIFEEATPKAAFLKMGLYGKNGSGKTFTATKVAIGLHGLIEAKKPVYFLDSETGLDYVLGKFNEAKIDIRVSRTRAFSDLLISVDEAEKNGSVLIVDSISHFWDDLVESYMKNRNLTRLSIRHWGEIKPQWRQFSARYVASKLHIILCGREGDVWQDVEDEEGVKELKVVGQKMRVEKELGYEPSLLVWMSLSYKSKGKLTHRAFVEKCRFDAMTFKEANDPGFEFFLPHIQRLNLGGDHNVLDTSRDSQRLFDREEDGSMWYKKHTILLEKIEAAIHDLLPGSLNNQEIKTSRLALMQEIFGTKSKTEIENMSNDVLATCLQAVINKVKIAEEARAAAKEKAAKKARVKKETEEKNVIT